MLFRLYILRGVNKIANSIDFAQSKPDKQTNPLTSLQKSLLPEKEITVITARICLKS